VRRVEKGVVDETIGSSSRIPDLSACLPDSRSGEGSPMVGGGAGRGRVTGERSARRMESGGEGGNLCNFS